MRRRIGSRGVGLVIALVTLAVTGILSAAAALIMRTLARDSLYQKKLIEAAAAAESGAEDALLQLAHDGKWRAGFAGKSCPGGYYDVSLSSGAIPTLVATGYGEFFSIFGRARRKVSFRVEAVPIPKLDYAILAGDTLSFTPYNIVNSYDSLKDVTPYRFDQSGDVASNAGIQMSSWHPVVYGNAAYKSGFAPPAALVLGSIRKLSAPLDLPTEDGSAYLDENDDLTGLSPSSVFDPAAKSLVVTSTVPATIASGIYYFHAVDIQGTLTVQVNNGPVVLFVDGPFTLSGKLQNDTHVPANLIIYGSGSKEAWTLAPQEAIYAAVVAPTRDLVLRQGVYGAVVGRRVLLAQAAAAVHFDVSLQRPKSYFIRRLTGTWRAGF